MSDDGFKYTHIIGVDIIDSLMPAKAKTILNGRTKNIFVSMDNIYLIGGEMNYDDKRTSN